MKVDQKQRRGSRGQATVEMALVLPILIWLLIGLVDVARMANAVITLQHATREAVRLGITGAADSEVTERAQLTATTLDPATLTITITPAGSRTTGSDITVKLDYKYKVLALMGIIGSEVPLSATLTSRVE